MLPDFEPDRSPLPAAAAGSSSSAGGAEKAPDTEQQQQQQAPGVLGASVASDEEYLAALVASSGKLQLLDQMLQELRGQGKQVLVLAHAPKVRLGLKRHAILVNAYV
jgi:primosomal protein N'